MRRSARTVFTVLIRDHELALRAFVRSCVDDAAATDDIVQETFLAAWQVIDQYDEARPFAAWVRGIARNKVLTHYRASAIARRHSTSLSAEVVDRIADEHELLTPPAGGPFEQRLEALRACLATLKDEERDVVEHMYRRQETCAVIAGRVGETVEAIKKRLQRARTKLRDCILGKLQTETNIG